MVLYSGALSLAIGLVLAILALPAIRSHDSSQALVPAENMERILEDLETGQLGFIATRDARFLRPWNAARASFPREARELQRHAAISGPHQGRRARAIVKAMDSYLREDAEPLVRAAQRDPRTAAALADRWQGGHGRIAAIRAQFDRFGEEEHRIEKREIAAGPIIRRSLLIGSGAAGAAFLVLLLAGFLLHAVLPARRILAMGARGYDAPPSMGDGGPATGEDEAVCGGTPAADSEFRLHRALRRLATLTARHLALSEIFQVGADELGELLGADYTLVNRFRPDRTATVVAHWSAPDRARIMPPFGGSFPVEEGTVAALVQRTGRPTRIADRDLRSAGRIGTWAWGRGIRSSVGCPILVAGELWGMLTALSLGAVLPDETEDRMRDVAEILAVAIGDARERDATTASRLRLVDASDAEGRALAGRLHDGAQQRLVSVGLELRTIEDSLPLGREELRTRIATVAGHLAGVIDDLQEIARDLYPAGLARGGLIAALRMLARRSAMPVELDLHYEGRLPRRVELAIHHIVAESLDNAARHANASSAQVGLTVEEGLAHLRVRDDGVGGADPHDGTGLAVLRDRVEALGGTFQVISPPGGGTSAHARIPIDED